MKSKLFLILLLAAVVLSCDKVENVHKKLTGVWTITSYTFLNSNSLTYYYPADGTMSFGSCGSAICNYNLNLKYEAQGILQEKINRGTMDFVDDEYFLMHRENSDGSISLIEYARVILLTKDDLKIAFTDEYGAHELVLYK